jgi:5-methylthioadenosine/S-adenosylhomocysteine deaminase
MTEFDKVTMLVHGGFVITDPSLGQSGFQKNAVVAVTEDGKVAQIGSYESLIQQYPDVPVEGGDGSLVMPGLIDAHSHGNGITYFELGLGYNHLESWTLFRPSFPHPDPYLNSIWCGIKHLRSGCTTIHHINEMGTWEEVASPILAYRDLGIRSVFSLSVRDQNLVTYDDDAFMAKLPDHLKRRAKALFMKDPSTIRRQYFDLFRRIRSEFASPGNPIHLGPFGPQWCSAKLLSDMKEEADRQGLRMHMHALQTPYQKLAALRQLGCTAIEFLRKLGVLGPHLTLGHAVWLTESDLDQLQETGCSVTHHASCNLNMRNGIMPLPWFLSKGITVAIGIDDKGINDDDDMLQELRVVEKLHRIADLSFGAPLPVTSDQILAMATINGAKVLGLDTVCGTLEIGKSADITVMNIKPRPWVYPEASPYDRLVMQTKATDVRTVIVEGKVILRDGKILTINEEDMLTALTKSIVPHKSAEARSDFLRELYPHIADFYKEWKGIPNVFKPYYVVNNRVE